ncbi:MAG: hypothetical protein H5T69_13080 [Chloroflexi bacterium]|nr:hypothetical protein [Chloroflexota bacterium]
MNAYPPNEPSCGRANQPQEEAWQQDDISDSSVVLRKGRLYLLCRVGAPPALLRAVARAYYTDRSFDVLPSLSAALVATYDEFDHAAHYLPLAVVLQGLEVYAVGSQEAVLWGVREGGVRELLAPANGAGLWPRGMTCVQNAKGAILYGVSWRLLKDDVLVLTTSEAATRLAHRDLAAIVRRQNPQAAAEALSRRAKAGRKAEPLPVTVLRLGGLQPIPELGPIRPRPFEPQPSAPRPRPRDERSPIWPALLVAAVAVGLALWVKRPSLTRVDAGSLLIRLLTPAASTTSAIREGENLSETPTPRLPAPTMILFAGTPRATATSAPTNRPASPARIRPSTTPSPAEEHYAPPQLLYPASEQAVYGHQLELRWSWEGILGEDDYFDVRVWPLGAPKQGIAWTKETQYIERNLASGWYSWTVVVVRGQEGRVERELSAEPKPVNFRWLGESNEDNKPHPTEPPTQEPWPTRITLQPWPTRVTLVPDGE